MNIKFVKNNLLIFISIIMVASCYNEKGAESEDAKHATMEKTQSEHITLINSFEVPDGKLEASIKYWEACRDFLKGQPGYISTKLHRSIKDDARFLLANVALWKTPQSFMEATGKMRQELGEPPVEGLRPNASLYEVIRE